MDEDQCRSFYTCFLDEPVANFKTHITVATVASGGFASVCLGAELVTPRDLLILWGAGALGGILPDIDSDHSDAIDVLFTLLALLGALLLTTLNAGNYAVAEMWLLWGSVYLFLRYPVMGIFKMFTVHRGIYHSVLAALMFWFATTAFCHRICGQEPFFAWLTGCAVFFGYLVHLALDELYAVDFSNQRLKRSWGSAFKLFAYKNPHDTLLMGLAVLILFQLCPSAERFAQVALDEATYQRISANLLPKTPRWVENLRSALHTMESQKQASENL